MSFHYFIKVIGNIFLFPGLLKERDPFEKFENWKNMKFLLPLGQTQSVNKMFRACLHLIVLPIKKGKDRW